MNTIAKFRRWIEVSLLGALVVVVVVVGICKVLSRTPTTGTRQVNSTAGWKTYRSALASLSIKYPPSYSERSGTYYLTISSPSLKKAEGDRFGADSSPGEKDLGVELYIERTDKSSVAQVVNARKNPPGVSGFQIVKESRILLGGVDALRYEWTGYGNGETIDLIHKGYLIEINKYPLGTSRQKEFEQILSTVKLIE